MSTSLDIHNCTIGTVSSKPDHSVTFRVATPELKVSESGELMRWHGRACRVVLFPHEGEVTDTVEVKTDSRKKTPSQKMRAVLFVSYERQHYVGETFPEYYERRMGELIDKLKEELPE